MDPILYDRTQKAAPLADQTEGLGLFDAPPAENPKRDPSWLIAPMSPIEHAFADFHARNRHVYHAIEQAALEAHQKGVRRLGIAKLVEDIRHDAQLRTQHEDFKLNNNFRALYARLLIHRHAALADMLATRERRETGHTDEGAAA